LIAFAATSGSGADGAASGGSKGPSKDKAKAKAKAKAKDKGKGGGKGAASGPAPDAASIGNLIRLGCAAPRLLPFISGAEIEPILTPMDLALPPPSRTDDASDFPWNPEED